MNVMTSYTLTNSPTDRRNSRMESRMRGNVQVRFGEGDTPYLKGSTVPTLLKDRIRLWKEGVRDLVMEICCALHLSLRIAHTYKFVFCIRIDGL